MFELIIKQKKDGRTYPEEHRYFSEDLKEMFDFIQLSIKLSKSEIQYMIREIEEGQVKDD